MQSFRPPVPQLDVEFLTNAEFSPTAASPAGQFSNQCGVFDRSRPEIGARALIIPAAPE
jgi:hypothetical protein